MEFVDPSHPILREKATEIPIETIASKEIQNLIDEMLLFSVGEREDGRRRVMVGLAATQVGISKQIILVDMSVDSLRNNMGDLQAFINPRILWHSEDTFIDREGCFSTGRITAIVPRSYRIIVAAYDRKGNLVIKEFEEYRARIFQHEIDHLHGIRFPDRIGSGSTLYWVEEHEYPLYRKHWRNWKRICPWSIWVALSKGENFAVPILASQELF